MTTRYATAEDLEDDAADALEALLFRLADDEFVHAERLTEWQIYAPTLESDLALANIAQDEYGHARLWYDLLGELGYSEPDCIWEKPPGQWRHTTLVERPFADDDWDDTIVRCYLYDVAERLRLEALVDTSYAPLADRVGKVLSEEEYHRKHAENWLDRLADSDARDRLQAAIDDLFPHALTMFEPGPQEPAIRANGFRTESLEQLREDWLDVVVPHLRSLEFTVPDPDAVAPHGVRGRDGTHTEAWPELYEGFTATYRELQLDEPVTLRGEQA